MQEKDLSGVMFPNKKTNERQPDLWGHCLIGGVNYKISAWKKKSKNDLNYLSISFQEDKQAAYKGNKTVALVSKAVGGKTEIEETIVDDEPLPF